MEQFSLEKYLENPSRKVVTRDGRKVTIEKTDIHIHGMSHMILGNYSDIYEMWHSNGRINYTGSDCNLDLFFADEENTNKILDELKSYLEKTPKEQIEKDWKEIQDWYSQHFTNEKHNEKEELTEFEEEELTEFEEELEMMMVSFSNRNLGSDVIKEMPKQKLYNYAHRLLDLAIKEIEKSNSYSGNQKQELNEEDEKMFNKIIDELTPYGECPDYPSTEEQEYYYTRQKMIDWLQSLKEKIHPNKE